MTDTGTSCRDLRAAVINCTLKRPPERSHTQGLIDISTGIMERQGVQVEVLRAVDHDIATGVRPDTTEHGWEADESPVLYSRPLNTDILTLVGPLWAGGTLCLPPIPRRPRRGPA
ncbi:hypothetical protein [Kitasatospora phosalacinea]